MSKKEINNDVVLNGALVDTNYKDDMAVGSIKDAKLRSAIIKYKKEEIKQNVSEWTKCRLIVEMTKNLKKDFGSDQAFADFMQSTRSMINKQRRIGEYADFLEERGYTVSKAFELLPLINKLNPKLIHSELNKIKGSDCTVSELREIVKHTEISELGKDKSGGVIQSVYTKEDVKAAKEKEAKKTTIHDIVAKELAKNMKKPKLSDENSTVIHYTFPWLEHGDLVDKDIMLDESSAKQVAKVLMNVLKEVR